MVINTLEKSFMKGMAIHKYTKQYLIFENGTIKSLINSNILSPRKNKNGYLIVTLYGKQLSVHRLVAEHFIPNPYKLAQVNHLDGNKEHNDVTNLEWCTAERNAQHALEIGLRPGFIPYPTKMALMYRAINGELIADLAREFPNTHPNTLSRMLRVTAKKEKMEFKWKEAMKIRRKNVAIRNLEKINNYYP